MATRRKKGSRKKKSAIGAARGAMFIAAKAIPAYYAFSVNGGGKEGVQAAGFNQFGMRPGSTAIDTNILMEQWAPLGAAVAADIILSKTGAYKRIGAAVRNIF